MLLGKNIILRCVTDGDLKDLHLGIPSLWFSEHKLRLQFYETAFWSDEMGMMLLVRDEKPIGAIWFTRSDLFSALNLHFAHFKEETKAKGYMKEALSLFSRHLFHVKPVDRLQLLIPNQNLAAIQLARSGSYQFEGILRSALFSEGAFCDICLYSLLRKEI
jgi:RimJ/RimL family protein N-acetyltransferase